MLYDTLYRHNQALSPAGLETVPAGTNSPVAGRHTLSPSQGVIR